MYSEIVITVLASLGGTSLVIAGLANHVGKIWADRIAQQTVAKYQQELEILKYQHTFELEQFKRKADVDLKDREYFGGISRDVIKNFLKIAWLLI